MRVWYEERPHASSPMWSVGLRQAMFEQLGDFKPRQGPVTLKLRFVFRHKQPRAYVPILEPSLPALERAVLNVLAGHAWSDERQILAVYAKKEHGNVSGVEITW